MFICNFTHAKIVDVFMMLTCDAALDTGDVVAITPPGMGDCIRFSASCLNCRLHNHAYSHEFAGRLILNLTKDTYERAGLTGIKSQFHDVKHGGNQRYRVFYVNYEYSLGLCWIETLLNML